MTSKAPENLVDLKLFLADQLDVDKSNFGIRGSCGKRRTWGFHLGDEDIYRQDCGFGNKDYSIAHKRNKRNLTNYSAALDGRLPEAQLKRIVAYMVSLGKSGWKHPVSGRTLFYEVIGPNAQGEATRWAVDTGWKPTKATPDHRWHFHIGLWRDAVRYGWDLRLAFLGYFGIDELPQLPGGDPGQEPDAPVDPPPGQPPIDPAPQPPIQLTPDQVRIAELEAAMTDAIELLADALEGEP